MTDNQHLVGALDGDEPTGSNLEYDARFLALEEMLRPAATRMVNPGDEDEGDDVDWDAATSLAYELAAETRDIRVSVRLTRALVRTNGLEGLSSGLSLTADLLENHWEHVHPQPDAEDNMDLMARFNALGDLVDPEMLRALELAAIAHDDHSREQASLRDIDVVIGKYPSASEDERSIAAGRLGAVFSAVNVVTGLSQVETAQTHLQRITEIWQSGVEAIAQARAADDLTFESMPPPEFDNLTSMLKDMARHIKSRLPSEVESGDGETGTSVASSGAGPIKSRADADRAISTVIEWYRRNEPSSPVPILLERARSMISKSFLEIVEELGDTGLAEARKTMEQDQGE